jgi:hypothetical protein
MGRVAAALALVLCACGNSGGAQANAPDAAVANAPDAAVANAPDAAVASAPDAGGSDGPCTAPEPSTAASGQTRARVGAYFFDGWTGSLSNYHFMGLPGGAFASREPLTGWLDSAPCVVEDELATARAFGIDFFAFDWYYGTSGLSNGDDQLNSAFEITRALPDRHGMQYAIFYISDTYNASPTQWTDAVSRWVSAFQDADYVRVNGKPLFIVSSPAELRQTFGSSAAAAQALATLRDAARAAGLPGVTIVGGIVAPYMNLVGLMERRVLELVAAAEGYDAIMGGSTFPSADVAGELPFSSLAETSHWVWRETTSFSGMPFLPVVVMGWDPRPWGYTTPWYTRSPGELGALVGDAIELVESTPGARLEPSPAPPLVLLDAWNEVGEGHYFIPTVGDGRSYGQAIASVLSAPQTHARTVISVDDGAVPRAATGVLTDAAGAAVAGANVTVTATALDGAGLAGVFSLADRAVTSTALGPPATAAVGFRVNSELQPPSTGPGPSDLAVYRVSFKLGDGVERVPDSDFAVGSSWSIGHEAQLVASDRGAGKMVKVQVTAGQQAELTSPKFAVEPGAAFQWTVTARVAPASVGSGAFVVIFFNAAGDEVIREWIPLASSPAPMGVATTDAGGHYSVSLAGVGTQRVVVEAAFAGDASHYPARAVTPR